MIEIGGIIAILLLFLIAWMWNSLGHIEKKTKITCIIIGFIVVYIATFIIFSISKIGIIYEDKTSMKLIRTVFVLLFTIVNGYIILPYVYKKLEKINNEEIKKEQVKKSIIILVVIILVLAIFEVKYLGNIQREIIEMMPY